jgi:hypothetical protein
VTAKARFIFDLHDCNRDRRLNRIEVCVDSAGIICRGRTLDNTVLLKSRLHSRLQSFPMWSHLTPSYMHNIHYTTTTTTTTTTITNTTITTIFC